LSDLHLWFSDRKLRTIERALERWRPDVVALTGDYADTPIGRRLFAQWLRRIAATYPVCWIAGNHDRFWGQSFLAKLEALSGMHAIDRRDAWIATDRGQHFRFTSWVRAHAPATVPGDDPRTIVLLHNPACIASHPKHGSNHLLLAGHLHGGQITLWHDRAGRPQPAAACYRWLEPRAAVGEATLIVSRGLGDSLPLRIGVPHEIVVVDFWG
jgi:predicted MPP superfamily phosphohydrolase